MGLVPASVDLSTETNKIRQGSTYVRNFAVTAGGNPVDFSGTGLNLPSLRFQMKDSTRTTTVIASNLNGTTIAWTNQAQGLFRITIPEGATTVLAHPPAILNGIYDVEAFSGSGNGGTVERIMSGPWAIHREISQAVN